MNVQYHVAPNVGCHCLLWRGTWREWPDRVTRRCPFGGKFNSNADATRLQPCGGITLVGPLENAFRKTKGTQLRDFILKWLRHIASYSLNRQSPSIWHDGDEGHREDYGAKACPTWLHVRENTHT